MRSVKPIGIIQYQLFMLGLFITLLVFSPGIVTAAHFVTEVPKTDNNATIIIPNTSYIAIDSQAVEVNDEIGVFTPRDTCAGVGIWDGQNLAITVWGDDIQAAGTLGFLVGDSYSFKIWDSSDQLEYQATAIFSSGLPTYQANGISVLDSLYYQSPQIQSPSLSDTLEIPLQIGWNQLSMNVRPNDASTQHLLQNIQNLMALMKNGVGEVYWPQYNIDQIDTLRITEGYQIKMDNSTTLRIVGTRIQPDTLTYTLSAGWNLISFPGPEYLTADTAMAALGNQLILMKDGEGNIYYSDFHIDNIGEMHIGQGYWVDMASSTTFRYGLALPKLPAQVASPSDLVVPQNTGNNATLLIPQACDPLFKQDPLSPGDEIRVYTPQELLVGLGTWENANLAITIWGDDPLTDPVEGLLTGESFQIRIWDQATNEELAAEVSYSSTEVTYAANALFIVDHLEATEQSDVWQSPALPDSFSLQQNFPNPVANQTFIRYTVPKATPVSIKIFDVLGQQVKTLVAGQQSAGRHIATWDGRNEKGERVSEGMYIYLMQAPEFQDSKKLILAQ